VFLFAATIRTARLHSAMSKHSEGEGSPLRILLVDNYDSYTFNLFQQIAVTNGGERVCFNEMLLMSLSDLLLTDVHP
jgi:hypothetical protein